MKIRETSNNNNEESERKKKKIVLRNKNAQFTGYRYAFGLPRKRLEKRINERPNKRVNTLDLKTFAFCAGFGVYFFFFTYLLFPVFFLFFVLLLPISRHLHRADRARAFCIQKQNRVYSSRRNAYDEDENKINRRRYGPGDPDWFSFRVFNRAARTAKMLTDVAADASDRARHRRIHSQYALLSSKLLLMCCVAKFVYRTETILIKPRRTPASHGHSGMC